MGGARRGQVGVGLVTALLGWVGANAQGLPPAAAGAPVEAAPAAEAGAAAETFDDPRLWWRAAAFACLGGGVVGLGLGGAVFAAGKGDESVLLDATRDDRGRVVSLNQREAQRLQDSAGEKMTLGALGLGVGGALAAAGILLLVLEPPAAPLPTREVQPKTPEVRPFSLAPSLGPDGPGLVFGLRF